MKTVNDFVKTYEEKRNQYNTNITTIKTLESD